MARTMIIGGTAAYHLEFGEHATVTGERMIATPFGEAGPVLFFTVAGQEIAFLSRHGGQGRLGVTPPFINYHANVWTAREVGASRILSWNSAGALVRSLEPGSLAVVSDLIDWTRARRSTFGSALAPRAQRSTFGSALAPRAQRGPGLGAGTTAEGPGQGPRLTGETPAEGLVFDPALRMALYRAAQGCGHRVAPGAVYAGTEGARLETAAEISLLAAAGAELVGMTMAPEAFLARELGLTYGSLCWVSNYATGIPFDGPERRLFGAEVGPLMFSIILKLLHEEAAA